MKRWILCFVVLTLLLSGVRQAHALVLYGADGAGGNPNTHLFILNPANGSVITDIGATVDAGGSHYAITGLAFHPTTLELFGSTSRVSPTALGHLVKIDPNTALVTDIGDFIAGNQTMADITFDPTTGTLYGWLESSADDLHTINLLTGAATLVGNSELGSQHLRFGAGSQRGRDAVLDGGW